MEDPAKEVSVGEFKRLELRVGTIVEATRVPKTEKLFKVTVDLGKHGRRQTITSLVGYYEAEQLLRKKIVFLNNLRPTKFAGQRSEGMLLAASDAEKLSLLTVDRDVPDGSRVS